MREIDEAEREREANKLKKEKKEGKQALIVTTAHRGVFFGYAEPTSESVIRLEQARMCLYWPQETKGVLGLASVGPTKGARVGPAAPAIIVRDVTAIIEVTPEAIKRWESAPWA